MAEQTFRSPGFFEREIDATAKTAGVTGVPAGVIGTAVKGPAFVPVTIGSFSDFKNRFGDLDADRFGPYAAHFFLKNRPALTYLRVLGAGANESVTDIVNTQNLGTVKNAGFTIAGGTLNASTEGSAGNRKGGEQAVGAPYFLAAVHSYETTGSKANTLLGYPVVADNPSIHRATVANSSNGLADVNFIRGMILPAVDTRIQILDMGETWGDKLDARASVGTTEENSKRQFFRIAISSSNPAYSNDVSGNPGVAIKTVSLNPSDSSYVGKVLNTDPLKFAEEKHLLYLDLPVEDELVHVSSQVGAIGLLSGSQNSGNNGLDAADAKFLKAFGRFDTRYTTPATPSIISQPFGGAEFDLFKIEALSDGAWANQNIKVSIANLRASTDGAYPYGTFEVQVRRFADNDFEPEVLESFPGCNLDPNSENFIARKIGDYKARYDFDQELVDERRIVVTGRYPNQSLFVRVVMSSDFEDGVIPKAAIPFGFRGIEVIKTTDSLTDDTSVALSVDNVRIGDAGNIRLHGGDPLAASNAAKESVGRAITSGSIIPPLPLRYKITRGDVSTSPTFSGQKGTAERVDTRLYWGLKSTKLPEAGTVTNPGLNANVSSLHNGLVDAYVKFHGIAKLDNLVTGSGADNFNANKFTLARVALQGTGSGAGNLLSNIKGSATNSVLDAAYIRNAVPDKENYTIDDPGYGKRVSFATLVNSSSVKFNRYTQFLKFTVPVCGGFDGFNPLDKDSALATDKAASTEAGSAGVFGMASEDFKGGFIGLHNNPAGVGRLNNAIFSYRVATRIMTDPMTVRNYILSIPGIRDPFVTDFAADSTRAYGQAMYLMDIPSYSEDATRLFGTEDRSLVTSASLSTPDVQETAESFESRAVDNNYCAAYFPDVFITDPNTSRMVKVPSTVSALSALGFNDAVAYPWFAPAGFNRGGLSEVANTDLRLNTGDRDTLYDARINPIANFADGTFVIFGQKTLQLAQSALDRVNVRRMLLEVKRQVVAVADKLLFEPNNDTTRGRFISQVTPLLATIQAQQGIEMFQVVMDNTNNSQEDVENNRLNGKIVVVPTRAIEFIAIDFIITNSGVSFE